MANINTAPKGPVLRNAEDDEPVPGLKYAEYGYVGLYTDATGVTFTDQGASAALVYGSDTTGVGTGAVVTNSIGSALGAISTTTGLCTVAQSGYVIATMCGDLTVGAADEDVTLGVSIDSAAAAVPNLALIQVEATPDVDVSFCWRSAPIYVANGATLNFLVTAGANSSTVILKRSIFSFEFICSKTYGA